MKRILILCAVRKLATGDIPARIDTVFPPFPPAKGLGQGAVGPGVLPHEPGRGGLLWPGVPEPSKDNGEIMVEKNPLRISSKMSSLTPLLCVSYPQVWLDHIKPIIKQLRREYSSTAPSPYAIMPINTPNVTIHIHLI